MADNIVGSLFGVNPELYQQNRDRLAYNQDLQAVQLDPIQQANLAIRQGSRGLGRAAGGLLGLEDPELAKVSQIKQLSSQFDLTTPAGMRQFSRALQQIAPNEAMMAGARADEMEKSGLGLQKTRADIALQERKVSQDEKLREALAALPDNATDAQYLKVFRQFGTPDQQAKAIEASINRKAKAAEGGVGGFGKLNTAEKAVDTKFGKEYADFFAGGGINSLEKNVSELARAIKIIEDAPEGDTSGKVVGLADKTGQLTFVSPLAADVKDIIGGVAQSNLRQILGGQFAAKEGEALLQRQYDTGQTKDNNLKRLRALYTQASDTIKDKKSAAEYYEQFGTLKGFKGTGSSTKKEETPAKGNKKTRTLKSGLVVTIED